MIRVNTLSLSHTESVDLDGSVLGEKNNNNILFPSQQTKTVIIMLDVVTVCCSVVGSVVLSARTIHYNFKLSL